MRQNDSTQPDILNQKEKGMENELERSQAIAREAINADIMQEGSEGRCWRWKWKRDGYREEVESVGCGADWV